MSILNKLFNQKTIIIMRLLFGCCLFVQSSHGNTPDPSCKCRREWCINDPLVVYICKLWKIEPSSSVTTTQVQKDFDNCINGSAASGGVMHCCACCATGQGNDCTTECTSCKTTLCPSTSPEDVLSICGQPDALKLNKTR